MKKVQIFTDGACSGNPGVGGWACILFYGKTKKEFSGAFEMTTNNKMELQAVIEGLKKLKESCAVEVFSDSAYVINAFKEGWANKWKANGFIGSDKKTIKNVEQWKELLNLSEKHKVNWVKVKGHSDNEFNNRCDELAVDEIKKFKIK